MSKTLKKIIKSFFSFSSSEFIERLLSALTLFILLKFISLEDYGIFLLAFSFAQPIISIATISKGQLFVTEYAWWYGRNEITKIKSLFWQYFLSTQILMIILVGIGWIFHGWLSFKYGSVVNTAYWYITLFAFLQVIYLVLDSFLQGRENFLSVTWISVGESLVKLGVIIYYAFFGNIGITILFRAFVFAKFLALFVLIFYFFKIYRNLSPASRQFSWYPKELFELFKKHGKWYVLQSWFLTIISSAPQWLVTSLLGVSSLALYQVGHKAFDATSLLFPFSKIIHPIVSRRVGADEEVEHLLQKAKKYTFAFSIVVYLLAFFSVGPLFSWFFPEFLAAVGVVKILLLLLLVKALSVGQIPLLFAHKKQKLIFYISFTVNFLFLLIFWVLSKWWGIIGSAISDFLLSLSLFVIYEFFLVYYYKLHSFSLRSLFQFDESDLFTLKTIFRKNKENPLL